VARARAARFETKSAAQVAREVVVNSFCDGVFAGVVAGVPR
jgi:hypothetical protein